LNLASTFDAAITTTGIGALPGAARKVVESESSFFHIVHQLYLTAVAPVATASSYAR
jgi:hypothetical protein